MIRFRFSPAKAQSAIQIMLQAEPRLDLHTVLKVCYFADKAHLNSYGRPVFGATYRAMSMGPLPVEVYELIKGEPLWLAELAQDQVPWKLDGYHLVRDKGEPYLGVLSRSDISALESALALARSLTLTSRTAETHGRDWQAARLGEMRYEDMLEPGPDLQDRIEHIAEISQFVCL